MLNTATVAHALTQVNLNDVPVDQRSAVMGIVIARLIAWNLPLSQVEDGQNEYNYFNLQYRSAVTEQVAAWNEVLRISIDDVVELVRRLWVFRYRVAYNPLHDAVSPVIEAVCRTASEIDNVAKHHMDQYAEHISAADQVFRPLVVSLSSKR